MLKRISPMKPMLRDEVFQSKNWLYQAKWDGVRMLAYLDQGNIRLINGKGADRTERYPDMIASLSRLPFTNVILDGELVVFHQGKSDFFQILKRDLVSASHRIQILARQLPVHFMIFDLLYEESRLLIDQYLSYRQARLQDLFSHVKEERIQQTDSFDDGSALWEETRHRGWEGIIMKEREGLYHPGGKHPTWQKVKHFRLLTATVSGVILGTGGVHSLALALPEGKNGWRYIGRAGSGLSAEERQILADWYPSQERSSPTVVNPPSDRDIHWIVPSLQVKVRYLEWTPVGSLRSPRIEGFLSSSSSI
ncbi:bifunctional non-homologous end joining protein LigD [Marininema mesophilum]|uniref:DNA ligase (ATP) n=1 Tax=Marininema mesophilum TaxID=1048340 RepID=A0A1H2XYI0_9BACL|nr:hypothetical protein [Marininema mesophilum]SDW97379.1 bifunctional non-homologous end joining protein LigD [Marininema mesophilum]